MFLFVLATVPLAILLNVVLLAPLPVELQRRAQAAVDSVLHFPIQAAGLTFSLFHLILVTAAAVYLSALCPQTLFVVPGGWRMAS